MQSAASSVPERRSITHLAALSVSACLWLLAGGTVPARAATVGIVPPRNPASDCRAHDGLGIAAIDSCRAAEGVGPLRLPKNWDALTPVQRGFVLIDLERVNRGLAPIVGLSAPLNRLASAGAVARTDPAFPPGGVTGGGIWADAPSVLAAAYLWMYADGPGGDNLDCSSSRDSGCWGHRDIILWDRTSGPLVAGGGFAQAAGSDSLAYLVLSDYSQSRLTFSWAHELLYFRTRPGTEPLGGPANHRLAMAIRGICWLCADDRTHR